MGIRLARARTGSWGFVRMNLEEEMEHAPRWRPRVARVVTASLAPATGPPATPASVSGGSFLAGCISGDHAVLRFGIWRIAVAAGTTQGEAVLWRDSETIAWCDWDVTATQLDRLEVVQLAGYRPIRKELSDG